MTRPVRVFINGFGRIGRTIFRQLHERSAGTGFVVVGINDVAPADTLAYLLRYDSVYGMFPAEVSAGPGCLYVAGREIALSAVDDLRALDLSTVDVVLECTGRAGARDVAEAGRAAGARFVLISGPSEAADRTIVLGANGCELGDAAIVSNASCTTNAIAPLLRVLDLGLGIERAHVTTIHCYTGSQPTVDKPGPSFERSRAAAVSMIPTSTSAAGQVFKVLPGLEGRVTVSAVRVPSLSVSAIDATIQLATEPDEPVVDFLREAFAGSHLVGLVADPCVSTDLRARPESLNLALAETLSVGATQLRVFGWYDNEWGFSARMIEMAERMAARTV